MRILLPGDILLFEPYAGLPWTDEAIVWGEHLEYPHGKEPLFFHAAIVVNANTYAEQLTGGSRFTPLLDIAHPQLVQVRRLNLDIEQRKKIPATVEMTMGHKYDWPLIAYLGMDYLLDGADHFLYSLFSHHIPQNKFRFGKAKRGEYICSTFVAHILRKVGVHVPSLPSPEDLAYLPGESFVLD